MNQLIEPPIFVFDIPGQNSPAIRTNADNRVNCVGRRQRRLVQFLVFVVVLLLCVRIGAPWVHAQGRPLMMVGTPAIDAHGVKSYPVTSIYQGSQQQIVRVLEPTNPVAGKPRRLLFVLPVDSGVTSLSSQWSDGLEELRLLDVPNRFNMTLIAPSFNYEPWYGDNAKDPTHRMESFIIEDLVPFADTFRKESVPQRYLIGFSKSGNGALALILRHPKVFNAAAAWDAPAELSDLSEFPALALNFGTQENFDLYNIPALVSTNADAFQRQKRLWISGDHAAWTADMIALDSQLSAALISHSWVKGGVRVHSWNSGWLNRAVSDLDANATLTAPVSSTVPQGQPAKALIKGPSLHVKYTPGGNSKWRSVAVLLGLLLVAAIIWTFLKRHRQS